MIQAQRVKAKPAVPPRDRLSALQSLSALLDAGIDIDQAFQIAVRDLPAAAARRLHASGSATSPVERLLTAGVLLASERSIAAALNETGRLDRGLKLVANRLEARQRMQAQIKARLTLSIAILILVLFIGPLPSLVAGEIGLVGYLAASLLPLLLLASLAWLAWHFWSRLAPLLASVWPFDTSLARRCDLMRELGHLLDAGVDADRAMLVLVDSQPASMSDPLYAAAKAVRNGRPIAYSLAGEQLIKRAHDLPLLDSAEQSGRLSPTMLHRAEQLEEQLNLRNEIIAEWLPRLCYALVVAYVAYSLLGGTLSGVINPAERHLS